MFIYFYQPHPFCCGGIPGMHGQNRLPGAQAVTAVMVGTE